MRYAIIGPFSLAQYFPVDYQEVDAYLQKIEVSEIWIKGEEISKKGKVKSKRYWHKYSIDEGKVIRFQAGFRNKETRYSYDYLKPTESITETVYRGRKGKLKERKVMHETTGKGELYSKDMFVINRKGDTVSLTIVSPRDTINNTSTDYYYKKEKLKYTWFNEYYPNKSLKKTSFYTGKGKLKYVWDYQCKDEGIEVNKHKDTSTICLSKKYDSDSTLTTIYHTVGAKGKITKTINKTNSKGRLLSYHTTDGPEDMPCSDYELSYAEDDTTRLSSVSRTYIRGKLSTVRLKSFDSEMHLVSSVYESYKKGNLSEETSYWFVYDSFGRPIKKIADTKKAGTQEVWYLSYLQ
jgi:hypothetical protein